MASEVWMSVKETSAYLGVTPKAVYDFLRSGGLPFSRLGKRHIRIKREWVDRWMEQTKTVNT